MKKNIFLATTFLLISQIGFAQEERIEVSGGAAQYLRSKAEAYTLNMNYKNADGLFVPVTISVDEDIRRFSAGVGLKTDETKKMISYSVAAALSHLSFSENLQNIHKNDRSRIAVLLQQELSFQLSKRVGLGIHFDLDVFNGLRRDKHKSGTTTAEQYRDRLGFRYNELTDSWYDGGGYQIANPDYQTDAEKIFRTNSMTESSASSFGVSLKIRLGK